MTRQPVPATLHPTLTRRAKSLERPAVADSSTNTEMPPDQPRHSFRHPHLGRFCDLYETGELPEYHDIVDTIIAWSDEILA